MEKDKKYNIVLGLMIFFFILFAGVCLAWGLGVIGLKDNDIKEANNNDNVIEDNADNQNISNIEEVVLEEYIEKVYKRHEISIPEFKNINDADEEWLWGVVYNNCDYKSIDTGEYVDNSVVYRSEIVEKGKELFGAGLTKTPPLDSSIKEDSTKENFIEYNSKHDCFINVGRSGALSYPKYIVSEIFRENDIFTVIIVEYWYDESDSVPGFGNEGEPFTIRLNSDKKEVVGFKSNEKFDVEKYVVDNKDKFVQKKLTIKNNAGKYNLASCEIIK